MSALSAIGSQVSAAQFQLQYQAAVFNKIKDMQQLTGEAAIKLIQAAAPPPADPGSSLGQNINIHV